MKMSFPSNTWPKGFLDNVLAYSIKALLHEQGLNIESIVMYQMNYL